MMLPASELQPGKGRSAAAQLPQQTSEEDRACLSVENEASLARTGPFHHRR